MSLKSKAKQLLGYTPLKQSIFDKNDASSALKNFIKQKGIEEKIDKLPPKKNLKKYNDAIAKMEPAYNFLNVGVHEENPDIKEIFEYDNLLSGTPLKYRPFPGSMRAMRKTLRSKKLYWYPRTQGGQRSQQDFLEYLAREGFNLEESGIGIDNVVFTCSTTHAYSLVMNTIATEGDVILMPAPNYGLFAIMTELDNFRLETIDLKEEDNWFVNPKSLEKRIDEINAQLKKEYAGQEKIPRVAAFLNYNPHNPIGNVMTIKEREILEGIGDVCEKKGIFIIDDLVYRDLTYDLDHLAYPIACMPKYFNNTISLFGISKAYGLASIRSAVVLAPLPVARMLAKQVRNTMDSTPVVQVAATAGAFNGSNRRYKEWRRYMTKLVKKYQYNYELIYALFYGIDKIKDKHLARSVEADIKHYAGKDSKILLEGCKGLKIKFKPQSGFFIVADFTKLKGKKTPAGKELKTEDDVLSYFYSCGGVKYLMGGNFFWPNTDEFVGRVSFGLSKKAIVQDMAIINKAIRDLK